jgi:SH3-like domain-containing protein
MTKTRIKIGIISAFAFLFIIPVLFLEFAYAQGVASQNIGSDSKLPLPRFVSLKADEVNARVGPGGDYKIAWVFRRAGLPVEVLAEYEKWRQVRDSDGGTGWVSSPLISARRTAIVAPWVKDRALFQLASSRGGSTVVAQIEPGAIVDITDCDGEHCEVYAGKQKGFLPQKNLWGVYPGEKVK